MGELGDLDLSLCHDVEPLGGIAFGENILFLAEGLAHEVGPELFYFLGREIFKQVDLPQIRHGHVPFSS